MQIGINVFSCSRFPFLIRALNSYFQYLEKNCWDFSFIHEDCFEPGIEKIEEIARFSQVILTEPPKGVTSAFYTIYTNLNVRKNTYNIHLEDDWVFTGEPLVSEIIKIMEKERLLQVYFSSKKTLEEGIARTNVEPDYYIDNKRLGLFLGRGRETEKSRYFRMGHMVPNTTPHLGIAGLFDTFIRKVEEKPSLLKTEITPRRAWSLWRNTLPSYTKGFGNRYGFLVQSKTPLLIHIGSRKVKRLRREM